MTIAHYMQQYNVKMLACLLISKTLGHIMRKWSSNYI